MALRGEHPTTKADEIAHVLEEAILVGELPPGLLLRQEQLSEEFGVSRTPIREALQKLAALELVSFAGQKGVQVRLPTRDELLETFTVRAALEGFAASLAVDRLTDQDLQDLAAAEANFARLTLTLRDIEQPDPDLRPTASRWITANAVFHDVYLKAANVPKLLHAAQNARRVFFGQAAWPHNQDLDELYALNLDQHRAILNAFSRRSPAVRELVEGHILDSGRLLESALDQAGYGRGILSRRVSWNSQGESD